VAASWKSPEMQSSCSKKIDGDTTMGFWHWLFGGKKRPIETGRPIEIRRPHQDIRFTDVIETENENNGHRLVPSAKDEHEYTGECCGYAYALARPARENLVAPADILSGQHDVPKTKGVYGWYTKEAEAIAHIRCRAGWSQYVTKLVKNVQHAMRQSSDLSKLRFLLYPSRLLPNDLQTIKQSDEGMIWLT
jgi:hypothetical protein